MACCPNTGIDGRSLRAEATLSHLDAIAFQRKDRGVAAVGEVPLRSYDARFGEYRQMDDDEPFDFPAPPKPCPDGHGLMEVQPGYWALQGVSMDDSMPTVQFGLNGQGMVLKVWVCPECQLARMYAEDR